MPKRLFQLISLSILFLIAGSAIVAANNNCIEGVQGLQVTVYTAKGSEPISFSYTPCTCDWDDAYCFDTARPGGGNVAITKTVNSLHPVIRPGEQNTIYFFPADYMANQGSTNEFCCDSRTQQCVPGKCKEAAAKVKRGSKSKDR